jgi:multicomponent Na+:H+ antiporter subunit E
MIFALRAALFFGLWLVIAGPAGLVVGALAALAAAWVSLRLLPPGMVFGSPGAALRLLLRVVTQSVVAGIDIARRVFDPRLPLQPGMITYATRLPPGALRDGFTALSSLAPGALPAGLAGEGRLAVHALDTRMKVAEDLATSEALFARAAPSNG